MDVSGWFHESRGRCQELFEAARELHEGLRGVFPPPARVIPASGYSEGYKVTVVFEYGQVPEQVWLEFILYAQGKVQVTCTRFGLKLSGELPEVMRSVFGVLIRNGVLPLDGSPGTSALADQLGFDDIWGGETVGEDFPERAKSLGELKLMSREERREGWLGELPANTPENAHLDVVVSVGGLHRLLATCDYWQTVAEGVKESSDVE